MKLWGFYIIYRVKENIFQHALCDKNFTLWCDWYGAITAFIARGESEFNICGNRNVYIWSWINLLSRSIDIIQMIAHMENMVKTWNWHIHDINTYHDYTVTMKSTD